MQRWHAERALLLRRWAVEKKQHTNRVFNYIEGDCHCLRGPGFLRKRRPFGHKRKCFLCRGRKYWKNGRPKQNGTSMRGGRTGVTLS